MPPWKPTRGVGPKLKHDQSLTSAELAVLAAWADAGAPRGEAKDQPPPPRFGRGYGALFSEQVTQANEGCDFEFLARTGATPDPEPNPQ